MISGGVYLHDGFHLFQQICVRVAPGAPFGSGQGKPILCTRKSADDAGPFADLARQSFQWVVGLQFDLVFVREA